MGKLLLGSTYLLYTKSSGGDESHPTFYAGIKVSVDSVLTYSEVNTLYPGELNSTIDAHNIINDDGSLEHKQFYKCSYLKDSTPADVTRDQYVRKIYIVWDDIINDELTTRLDASYKCNLTFKITNNDDPITSQRLNDLIKNFIEANSTYFTVTSEYGDGVNSFIAETSDPNSDIYAEKNDLEAKLSETERVLDIINLMKSSCEKLTKDVVSLNLGSTVSSIAEKVEVINEKVDIIQSNLS